MQAVRQADRRAGCCRRWAADLLYEFLTRTPMVPPKLSAGCMASGCSTVAPKKASSVASSNVSRGTGAALSTMRGSEESTPSTSFHTCTGSAQARPASHAAPNPRVCWASARLRAPHGTARCSPPAPRAPTSQPPQLHCALLTWTSGSANAAPISVQLRSLPPRPSVVMAPVCRPRPRNPVTIGSGRGPSAAGSISAARTAGSVSS